MLGEVKRLSFRSIWKVGMKELSRLFGTTRTRATTWRATLPSIRGSGLCSSNASGKADRCLARPFSLPFQQTEGCAALSTWEKLMKFSGKENMSSWCKICKIWIKTCPLKIASYPNGKSQITGEFRFQHKLLIWAHDVLHNLRLEYV